MKAKDLEEQLATIAKQAKPLRDAGVVGRVTIGDVSFELADIMPAPAQSSDSNSSAIDDPVTFGGEVPERKQGPIMPRLQDGPRTIEDDEE